MNDTCFGINNEGELSFDYYHEDSDVVDSKNVYNGQNSTLWVNFREAYADKIKETYQKLRSDGLITYDILEEQFIMKGSDKWSESVFNEDGEFKYVSMVKSDDDASKLAFLRGDGEQHFRYFVENRLNYCDSKWYASDYANDYVSLRIYTPVDANGTPLTNLAVPANANISVVPYSDMYAGVRYKANGTLYQERVSHGQEITFQAPNETFNDTETAIYGASQLSSLGDLAPLYCGTVDVSMATKLTEIKIGDGTTGYANNNLESLSVGTNKLLKKIDIQNCPALTTPLGLKGCQNIEEIYAKGSGITGVELADSGYLKIVQLPGTIANLTIKNQEYIEEFSMEGYSALKTMQVENCPAIDTLSILDNATNLERVRLTGVEWEYDDTSFLYELWDRNLAGIDENGSNTDKMWIDGKCHIGTLTGAEFNELKTMFPYLTITYGTLESQLIYMDKRGQYILVNDTYTPTVDEDGVLVFGTDPSLSEDGALVIDGASVVEELTWTEVYRETILNAGNGSCPVEGGLLETPVKAPTSQYIYTFGGWAKVADSTVDETALLNVEGDRVVYPAFNQELRYYTVNFYIDGTLKETYQVPYGGSATFSGSTVHPTNPDIYEFVEWKPSPANITGDTNCYAQYYDIREIQDDWATIAANCNNGTATTKYAIGAYKPVYIGGVELPYKFYNGGAVVYNGELHLFGGQDNETKHYKWDGATWIEVSTIPYRFLGGGIVVYNNEIHLLGGTQANEGNKHYKWNGTEWTRASTLPYLLAESKAVVYNNEIHILGSKDTNSRTKHYKWNNSEWIEVSTLPYEFYAGQVIVYNNEIHILGAWDNNQHYKWNGYKWTEDVPMPVKYCNSSSIVYNNEIHILGGRSIERVHYKFNGTEWTSVGKTPFLSTYSSVVMYNNMLHLIGSSNTSCGNKFYYLSDSKWLPVNTSETIPMEVIAHNHDELCDGIKKWEDCGKIPYLSYEGATVIYNNEIHNITCYGNGKHYKWNGTEWVEVSTLPYNFRLGTAVVYNDEIHILGSRFALTSHYKWNGTEWVEVSTLPFNLSHTNAVVYNNEIHIFDASNTKYHYKWNGTEWISVGVLPYNFNNSRNTVVYNDEIHAFINNGAEHYTWNETDGWIKIDDCPYRLLEGASVVYDNKIHHFGGTNNRTAHYTWDEIDGWVKIDTLLPYAFRYGDVVLYNNEIHLVGGQDNAGIYSHFKWSTASCELIETLPWPYTGSYGKIFELNNKLYTLQTGTFLLREWDGNEWADITTLPVTGGNDCVITVHEGNIYAYLNTNQNSSAYYQKLYKYDWNEWTEVCSGFPISGYGASLCSYNNRLYLIGGYYTNAECIYYLDGTNWVKEGSLATLGPCKTVIYNNELHVLNSKKHYKFNGVEWTTDVSILPSDIGMWGTTVASTDKYIYALGGISPYTLYRWDGINWSQVPCNLNLQYSNFHYFRGQLHVFTNDRKHSVITNPKATLTFFAKNALKDNRAFGQVNNSDVSLNDWSNSTLRTWCNDDLLTFVPSDLKDVIKPVIKLGNTVASTGSVDVVSSNDNMWIPSLDEVGITDNTFGLGHAYSVFTDNKSRIRTVVGSTQGTAYWVRDTQSAQNQYSVSYIGKNNGGSLRSNANKRVVIGFCI